MRLHSLGNNCEPGMFLRSLGLLQSRGVFAWGVTPFPQLCTMIESDFAGVFEPDDCRLVGIMIEDQRLGVSCHSPMQHKNAADFGLQNVDDLLRFNCADRRLRGEAFLQQIRKPGPSTFVLKYEGQNAFDDGQRLHKLLIDKGAHRDSRLIVVQAGAPVIHSHPGISYRYVPTFAPFDDVESYDRAAWYNVFPEGGYNS